MCTMDLSFELQEVLLVRPEGGERLGLTLCYETDAEDGLTDIFVDDIHPDGLAAADGRLRLGDQIIQVGVTKSHKRDHQDSSNDTPLPVCGFSVRFPSLWMNWDDPLSTVKRTRQ